MSFDRSERGNVESSANSTETNEANEDFFLASLPSLPSVQIIFSWISPPLPPGRRAEPGSLRWCP